MEEDLPLFAIAKQIQHQFPNENGKDIYFWFREGHLEKAPFNFFLNRWQRQAGETCYISLILQDCGIDIK